MKQWLALLTLVFVSCLDFEFQSPYEDLNGIYLEHIRTYDAIEGRKLQLDNSRGYVCSTWPETLSCYDFSDAYAISPISSYGYDGLAIFDFAVQDAYAYIVGGWGPPYFVGIAIVDFNQPQPTLIGSTEISYLPSKVKLRGDYAYIAGGQNISVVDVQDKTSPIVLAVHYFDSYIVSLELDSNYAYVLFGNNDFQILDISEPSQIHTVWSTSLLDTTAHPDFFTLNGRYIYVAISQVDTSYRSLINVYHITDSPGLEYVSSLELPAQIECLFAKDTVGLALADNVYLLNLRYPTRPCVSEILQEYDRYGIIKDNYIYLLDPKFKIFEIREAE